MKKYKYKCKNKNCNEFHYSTERTCEFCGKIFLPANDFKMFDSDKRLFIFMIYEGKINCRKCYDTRIFKLENEMIK